MSTTAQVFGELPGGGKAFLHAIKGPTGMQAGVLDYGAAIHSLEVPLENGGTLDVVLGHADLSGYISNRENLGVVVGRNANRIGDAAFELGGRRYRLEANNGRHSLHSGSGGFAHRLFTAEPEERRGAACLRLTCRVPHLSDGFPGNLDVDILYTLTDDHALRIDYSAVSDADTVFNPTNHTYFNLAGHAGGPVRRHEAAIDADFHTPVRTDKIPTGEVARVAGTPYDFTSPKPIGPGLDSDDPHVRAFSGYDVNFALNGRGFRRVASLANPENGLAMEIHTDLPGMQFFTGNSLDPDIPRKGGVRYDRHHGVCFETQFFPDAVNRPWFPSPILPAGKKFVSTTLFRFFGGACHRKRHRHG